MIEVKSLETIPPECAQYTGGRITFSANGLRLTTPSALEDKAIRWMLERGYSLERAYAEAMTDAARIYPATELVPCITEVLSTKYFDPISGEWKRTGGQYTCIGFQKCFVEYLTGQREYPGGKRMEIASGIFAPSPQEELCIKQDYYQNKNITGAYTRCGASDIIPKWSGALAFISNALDREPMGSLYEIIKTSYRLVTVYPATPSVTPPPPPTTPTPKKKTWLWIGLGVLGLLILSEGEGKKKAIGQLGQIEPELFKVPRGRLVLKHEDVSTSEDPVIQCLEHQGWNVKRVQELQEDIAAKMTPDIFTGKTEPLTGGEKMLQEAIDRCLERIKSSRSRRGQPSLFSGDIMSCESWYEDPYTGWHCFIYAPSCRGQAACKSAGDRQLKTCVETRQVEPKSDRYKVKWITRCARYAPACSSIQCLEKAAPMPRPPEPPEKEIKSLARALASQATAKEKEAGPSLAREILSRGGIAPYRQVKQYGLPGTRYLMEEYLEIPLFLRRKKGLTADEMAAEMGMDEQELMRLIRETYKGKEIKRRFSWKDFYDEAKETLMREYRTTWA